MKSNSVKQLIKIKKINNVIKIEKLCNKLSQVISIYNKLLPTQLFFKE